MIDILIITGINILAMIALGWTFAVIELNEEIDTKEEAKRNDLWHRTKQIFLMLFFTSIAYAEFGINWNSVILIFSAWTLNVVIFNPSINLIKDRIQKPKERRGFFYLSKEGIEGKVSKIIGRKIYYLIFFLFFIGSLILLKFRL